MSANMPRVGGADWVIERPDAVAVYNSDYSPTGKPLGRSLKPWVVLSGGFERFATHSEAITHASKEAQK